MLHTLRYHPLLQLFAPGCAGEGGPARQLRGQGAGGQARGHRDKLVSR